MISFPYKVTYISEEEFDSKRIEIYKQIDREEWDNISLDNYAYAICKKSFGHMMFSEEIRGLLLKNIPYNDDTERTVIRLFGSRQYLEEANYYMNWCRLRYDIEKGNISDLNRFIKNKPLFIGCMNSYIENIGQKEKFDNCRFLLNKGANINIQDDKGKTLLHNLICRYKFSTVYFVGLKLYVDFLDFLLENGADPLLADKEGNTPYNILLNEVGNNKQYRFISRERIVELLEEIEADNDEKVRLCDIFYSLILKYV